MSNKIRSTSSSLAVVEVLPRCSKDSLSCPWFPLLYLLHLLPLPPVSGAGPRALCILRKLSATEPTPAGSSFPGHPAHRTGGANKPRTAKAVRQLAWWLPLAAMEDLTEDQGITESPGCQQPADI